MVCTERCRSGQGRLKETRDAEFFLHISRSHRKYPETSRSRVQRVTPRDNAWHMTLPQHLLAATQVLEVWWLRDWQVLGRATGTGPPGHLRSHAMVPAGETELFASQHSMLQHGSACLFLGSLENWAPQATYGSSKWCPDFYPGDVLKSFAPLPFWIWKDDDAVKDASQDTESIQDQVQRVSKTCLQERQDTLFRPCKQFCVVFALNAFGTCGFLFRTACREWMIHATKCSMAAELFVRDVSEIQIYTDMIDTVNVM